MLGQNGPMEGVAAGMGQLQTDEQVVRGAVCRDMGRSRLGRTSCRGQVHCRVDDELSRVGPAFGDDGARLAPDELGTAGTEPPKAAERQFSGRAVELAVTSSIGWIASRLPTDRPPTTIGRKSGDRSSESNRSRPCAPASASKLSLDLYLKYRDT